MEVVVDLPWVPATVTTGVLAHRGGQGFGAVQHGQPGLPGRGQLGVVGPDG